jgi:hypothetical protein
MWGTNANCYAYACNCKTPANGVYGAAIPGAFAGDRVTRKQNETDDDYYARLVGGIMLDAAKNDVDNCKVSWNILSLPDAGAGYIIAMIAKKDGFHFFRRDRITKNWTSKDGNGGEVEGKIFSLVTQAYVTPITDAIFRDAIQTNPKNYMGWPGMGFVAYVGLGNINGMTVAG